MADREITICHCPPGYEDGGCVFVATGSCARQPAPCLPAEERASLFIEWCALHGFGLEGWPDGAHAQLVAHLKDAAHGR